jgi:hypothetical protein
MEYKLKKEKMKMEFELCCLGQFALHSPSSGLGGSLFSAPNFPASNYSSPIALPTPTYSESYSATPYTSQTGCHGSQVNSVPSISLDFSCENLQRSHTGSPVASGSLPVNGGGFDFGKFSYDPSGATTGT